MITIRRRLHIFIKLIKVKYIHFKCTFLCTWPVCSNTEHHIIFYHYIFEPVYLFGYQREVVWEVVKDCIFEVTHGRDWLRKNEPILVKIIKSPAIVNKWELFAQHWCNLAAKDSGLECACVNNDDFTVDAIEWACALCGCHFQNDWVSRATNRHQILL